MNIWLIWKHYHLFLAKACCCSVAQSCLTSRTAAHQASLTFTVSQSLLKLISIESVMPCNRLILWRPLLLLPSIFPSIRVFSSESLLRSGWPNCWSFSISPSSEYSGLISFRIDWFDLSRNSQESSPTPQFKSISFSALSIFIVQLSHPHMTLENHSFMAQEWSRGATPHPR